MQACYKDLYYRKASGKYFFPEPELSNTTLDPSSDEGIASTNISLVWGETLPNLILAKSDEEFDTLYNEFLAKRDELGYEKVTAAVQVKVDANKVKLGLSN